MLSPSFDSTLSVGSAFISAKSAGFGNAMTWHSPVLSLAYRAVASRVIEKTSVSTLGLPRKCASNALYRIVASFWYDTNSNGPVPIG